MNPLTELLAALVPDLGLVYYRIGPDGRPEPCSPRENWAYVLGEGRVAWDTVGDLHVRTGFAGLAEPGRQPLLWQTVVITKTGAVLYWAGYDSREAATDGHQRALLLADTELC